MLRLAPSSIRSNQVLALEKSAFQIFHGGIRPLSTGLIKPNHFPVSLSHRRSTTVSLETRHFFLNETLQRANAILIRRSRLFNNGLYGHFRSTVVHKGNKSFSIRLQELSVKSANGFVVFVLNPSSERIERL